jgi:ABC-2 type transport system ATP-binding protein
VTSHILLEIERIADRVAILLEGRLLTVHPLDRAAWGAQLRIRARPDSAAAVAAVLAGTSGIADIRREEANGHVTWWVRAEDGAAAERITAVLCSAGIVSIERLESASDLEALFLRLTASKAAH